MSETQYPQFELHARVAVAGISPAYIGEVVAIRGQLLRVDFGERGAGTYSPQELVDADIAEFGPMGEAAL